MPGIVTQRHLIESIVDSVFPHKGTAIRLAARGLKEVNKALQLRQVEAEVFNELYPHLTTHLSEALHLMSKDKLKTGNTYVYKLLAPLIKLTRKKKARKRLQDRLGKDSQYFIDLFLAAKIPRDMLAKLHRSLPEETDMVEARYYALRTITQRLLNAFTEAGAMRSATLHASNKYTSVDDLRSSVRSLMLPSEGREAKHHYRSRVLDTEDAEVTLYRLSDLTVVEATILGEKIIAPLTRAHFERLTDSLKSFGNLMFSTFLHYGLNDPEEGLKASLTMEEFFVQMCKVGVKDSLMPGEAGKAASDMFKAKLSQTPELPFNNLQLLRRTYTGDRADTADVLLSILLDTKMDDDTTFNISFTWRMALQPDSVITDDFAALKEGLSKPNPIAEDAPEQLLCSLKRSILVAALREGRQPDVTTYDGSEVPPEIVAACMATRVEEKHLRLITAGSVKNVIVKIPDVYPDVHDTSHLRFKDKSSAIEGATLRKKITHMSEVSKALEDLEDEAIRRSAELRGEAFIQSLAEVRGLPGVEKVLMATSNDIISSMDCTVKEVFSEAEAKFKAITKSIRSLDSSYGTDAFIPRLEEWAAENPDLLINTVVEPKLGEVHKRVVRIFYMFEKGMKTFLSQFERLARIMDYSIKGAEIVKGDRAREKHMNILSSAHRAKLVGSLAYAILFDLSKFSQHFHHFLIDAAGKLIGELTDYPLYAHISDVFKASLLCLSARFSYASFTGVAGAFEGFLNFLWTGIHATVMDIALKACGRSGDLAAYSDDGLLLFILYLLGEVREEDLRKELVEVIKSLRKTYADFGLDFNLGKTILSRRLTEFLGQVMLEGKRLTTWLKEMIKVGRRDIDKAIYPMHQEVTDISSQVMSTIKAGCNPLVSYWILGKELIFSPMRRMLTITKQVCAKMKIRRPGKLPEMSLVAYTALPYSWGGARIPDIVTAISTADTNILSDTISEVVVLSGMHEEFRGIHTKLLEDLQATDDYSALFRGGSVVHTGDSAYSPLSVTAQVLNLLGKGKSLTIPDPLLRRNNPDLHKALEGMEKIDPTWLSMIGECCVPNIERSRTLAPDKSSALRRLLTKQQVRNLQRWDTTHVRRSIQGILEALTSPGPFKYPTADDLLIRSYPKLSFAPCIPASRDLLTYSPSPIALGYRFMVTPHPAAKLSGTSRLQNMEYFDELSPPLVSTDVSSAYLSSTPDLVSHCTRNLYSLAISAATNGADLTILIDAMCRINNAPLVPLPFIVSLGDLRKVAIANKKKFVHRVYWSAHVKSQSQVIRSGNLNNLLASIPHVHFSMLVTSALAVVTLYESMTRASLSPRAHWLSVNSDKVKKLTLHRMVAKPVGSHMYYKSATASERLSKRGMADGLYRALRNEAMRSISQGQEELKFNLLAGRLSMVANVRALTEEPDAADPLRGALLWALIHRIGGASTTTAAEAGVVSTPVVPYSLEGVPTYLVDYASIYVVGMRARKADLSAYANGKAREPAVSQESADSVTYAVDLLGLTRSVTGESLRSQRTAKVYLAMVAGEEIGLVYTALEPQGESCASPMISPARSRAVSRALEALISQLFKGKDYTPEADVEKFSLMILSVACRGSVHRSQPYNPTVVMGWLSLVYRAIVSAGRRLMGPGDGEEFIQHVELLHGRHPPLWGEFGQFTQCWTFLKHLCEWGHIRAISRHLLSAYKSPEEFARMQQTALYTQYVQPILTTVRTVSYNLVTHALNALGDLAPHLKDPVGKVEDLMATVAAKFQDREGIDIARMLRSGMSDVYRLDDGPLEPYCPRIVSPEADPASMRTLLAYAYALPFILASGTTGFSSICDYSQTNPLQAGNAVSSLISAYSIPRAYTGSTRGIIVIQMMSEYQILSVLKDIPAEDLAQSVLVIEIPPNASAWSIALIVTLTKGRASLLTLGISSDLMGVSLFLCVSVQEIPREILSSPMHMGAKGEDLGSMCAEALEVHKVDMAGFLLTALAATPLLQAGIPASIYIEDGGMIYPTVTSEELLDRSSISFIEASAPSKGLREVSSLPVATSAVIIRATKLREGKGPSVPAIMSAAAYSLTLVADGVPAQTIMDTITQAYSSMSDDSQRLALMTVLTDALNDLPRVSPSSFPVAAQMAEVELPQIRSKAIRIPRLVKMSTDAMRYSYARPKDLAEHGNPLVELYRERGKKVNYGDIIDAILGVTSDEEDDEIFEGVVSTEPAEDPSSYSGLGLAYSQRRYIAPRDDSSRAETGLVSITSASGSSSSIGAVRVPTQSLASDKPSEIFNVVTGAWADVRDEAAVPGSRDWLAEQMLSASVPSVDRAAVLAALASDPSLVAPTNTVDAIDWALDIADRLRAERYAETDFGVN